MVLSTNNLAMNAAHMRNTADTMHGTEQPDTSGDYCTELAGITPPYKKAEYQLIT